MVEPEQLYQDGDLRIELVPGCPQAYAELLEETVWGTEGLRYLDHGVAEVLRTLPDCRSACLWRGEDLVGAYALGFKCLELGGQPLRAVHRMFLTVRPDSGGKGYGRLLVEQVKRRFLDEAEGPVMLYGYIEDANTRSRAISERVGYQQLGSFESTLASRISPHDSPQVRPLGDDPRLIALLLDLYRDHGLVDLPTSLDPTRTWVLERGGELLAAAQVEERRWTVQSLFGGVSDALLWLLPRLPLSKRLFPGSGAGRGAAFPYLGLGNLYVAEGQGAAFMQLVEALMHRRGVHAAMWFTGLDCPVGARIKAAGGLGMLSPLGSGSQAHVMAGFHGVAAEQIEELRRRPLWVSLHDPI